MREIYNRGTWFHFCFLTAFYAGQDHIIEFNDTVSHEWNTMRAHPKAWSLTTIYQPKTSNHFLELFIRDCFQGPVRA